MIGSVELTTELPVSAADLRSLLQDPERLLRVSVDGRDIGQDEAGDWQTTEDLSLLCCSVTFTTRFTNTEKGVISDVEAPSRASPVKVRTHSEWSVDELEPQEGQDHRCSLRELTEIKCPWFVFPLVWLQQRKTSAALPQQFVRELQQ